MNRPRGRWLALGWAGLCVLSLGSPRASADDPAQLLKGRGLSAVGWVYIVEGEAVVHTKIAEAKASHQTWAASRARLDEQLDNQATIDDLTEQSNALKAEVAMLRQQQGNYQRGLNPQAGGFGQNAFNQQGGLGGAGAFGPSGFQQMQNLQDAQAIAVQLNQSQAMLNELSGDISQAKRIVLAPAEKQKLQDETLKQRDTLQAIAAELRKSVDEVFEKYRGLKSDPAVEQALVSLGSQSKSKPKLGPSREFQANAKVLDKIERSLASNGARVGRSSKAARKHKTKAVAPSKRSASKNRPRGDETKIGLEK